MCRHLPELAGLESPEGEEVGVDLVEVVEDGGVLGEGEGKPFIEIKGGEGCCVSICRRLLLLPRRGVLLLRGIGLSLLLRAERRF